MSGKADNTPAEQLAQAAQAAAQAAQARTPFRARPFKPTVSMSVYKDDYDRLVEYAYGKQVTLRQAFADAVTALGLMENKRNGDRQARSDERAKARAEKAKGEKAKAKK